MPRLLGLGLLLAASAASASAEPPVASNFALREVVASPRPAMDVRVKFETPQIDYSQAARTERKSGFLAAMQVMPGGFLGIGLSDKKARRSSLAPDPSRDARRGGKKLALKFSLDF